LSTCHFERSNTISDILTFSDINDLLSAHAVEHSNKAFLFTLLENRLQLRNNVLQMLVFWKIDIGLHLAILVEELESRIIDVEQSILISLGDRSINHVAGVECTFVLFTSQDVLALADDLGGTVLAWLGSGNLSNLAWIALHHNEGAVLESLRFDLLGLRGTGIGVFKFFVSHFKD